MIRKYVELLRQENAYMFTSRKGGVSIILNFYINIINMT